MAIWPTNTARREIGVHCGDWTYSVVVGCFGLQFLGNHQIGLTHGVLVVGYDHYTSIPFVGFRAFHEQIWQMALTMEQSSSSNNQTPTEQNRAPKHPTVPFLL